MFRTLNLARISKLTRRFTVLANAKNANRNFVSCQMASFPENKLRPVSSIFWIDFSINRRWYATGEKSDNTARQSTSFNVQDYDDFKARVLNSDKPVIVDFYADWCGPCKMLGPRLEMVVDNRSGKVLLAKVNVDDCSDLAVDYGVRSVPTVIAFDKGQPVDQFIGMQEEEQINAFISKIVPPK